MNQDRKFSVGGKDLMTYLFTAVTLSVLVGGILIFPVQPIWAAKKSVIVGMTQEPVNFNPLLYVNSGTEEVPEACMFDALWDINEKGEFVPNLAVKVPTLENGGISQDGKVWKIELKKGIKWHDGTPFTAKDVEFTYQTIINPKLAIRSRSGFDLISEFKIVDDHNVEIHLSKPFVPFAWAWQKMHIVPAHILSKEVDRVICEVIAGGAIQSHKGLNLPSTSLRIPAFTEKDREDLEAGLEAEVDFVALSFVRHEKDLEPVRDILRQVKSPPMLIAKIERPQAVERVEYILKTVDGVMVARGVPAENAYFETVAQLPQLAALLVSAGPDGFWHEISDCAAAGSAQAAPRLFGREFDARLRALWDQIESGRFARHLQRQGRPARLPASWQVLRDIEAAAKKRGGLEKLTPNPWCRRGDSNSHGHTPTRP